MKTLHLPAEELEARKQEVTGPQPHSSQESSKEEMQRKTPSLEAWRPGASQ